MADQFAEWGRLLALAEKHKTKAALRTAIGKAGIAIQEASPLSGYYRAPGEKNGALLPVAIWRQDDQLIVLHGGAPGEDARTIDIARVWPSCAWQPVSFDWYEAFVERTGQWPDAAALPVEEEEDKLAAPAATAPAETPKPVEQAAPVEKPAPIVATEKPAALTVEPAPEDVPADPVLAKLKTKVAAARMVAEKLYQEITSDDEAAAAQTVRSQLTALEGQADKAREAEKHPHLAACREVDEKWRTVIVSAGEGAEAIRIAQNGWLAEKKKQATLATTAAAAPETQVATARSSGETVTAGHNAPPERVNGNAPEQPQPPPATPPAQIKGASGRAAKVKTVNVITVTDFDALYAHVKAFPDIKAALTKAAQRLVDNNEAVPGVSVETKEEV